MTETATMPEAHVNGVMPQAEDAAPDDVDVEAERKALVAEVEADREYRRKLRKLRDQEETFKEKLASIRGQIKETLDEWLKGYSPTLFDDRPQAQTSEDWRTIGVGVLQDHELPATLVKKLGENECATLGQLSDLMNRATESGRVWWEVFNGVGQAKAEQIELALEKFWATNPQYGKEKANAVQAEGEGEAAAQAGPEEQD